MIIRIIPCDDPVVNIDIQCPELSNNSITRCEAKTAGMIKSVLLYQHKVELYKMLAKGKHNLQFKSACRKLEYHNKEGTH